MLGIVSPGMRKVMLVALMLSPLALSSCVHLKPGAEAKLISCGTDVMQAEVANVMPAVATALQGGAVDWQNQLDTLVAKVGGAALCALAVLVANLEVGGGAGEPAVASHVVLQSKLPTSVILTRAYSYQASHPFQLK